jgi:predicted DNA-binding protein (UPF0251 family)
MAIIVNSTPEDVVQLTLRDVVYRVQCATSTPTQASAVEGLKGLDGDIAFTTNTEPTALDALELAILNVEVNLFKIILDMQKKQEGFSMNIISKGFLRKIKSARFSVVNLPTTGTDATSAVTTNMTIIHSGEEIEEI